jgi:protein SCO1/2
VIIRNVLFAAAFAAGVWAEDFEYAPPAPGSYSLPVVKAAGDGVVVDHTGREVHLREAMRGRVTVLSFIYSRCASTTRGCPYATGVLRKLYQLSAEDAALAKGMGLISMSFDPAFDGPERMAAYTALADRGDSAATWRFLTAQSSAELGPILEAYGQAVDRKRNPFDPSGPLNHTLRVFLIDVDGKVRNIYSAETLDPRLVMADVRTLIMESQGKNLK